MKAAAPGPAGSSSIRRLEAKGNVVVTQKDQVVTGESAVFDTKTNLVTMIGGVVLTQGQNVLRGDRLVVDMTNGVSRVEIRQRPRDRLVRQSSGGPTGGPSSILPGRGHSPSTGPKIPTNKSSFALCCVLRRSPAARKDIDILLMVGGQTISAAIDGIERHRMVDILGMFRGGLSNAARRGFARAQTDITSLDAPDTMIAPAMRDAPAQPPARAAPDVEPPREQDSRPAAKPNSKPTSKLRSVQSESRIHAGDGRAGYLAVHSVEKSFGSRQVVRGVSIYVRRGEAVGLLGPNGAGKTTVFYMITGLIKADRGGIELDGHDVTKLPMYQRARLGIGYLPQEASIFRGLTVEQNIRAVLEVVEPNSKKRETNSTDCSTSSTSRVCGNRRRSPCRAANAAASRSRAHWRRGRTTCCSTSRSPASIRSPSATFRISSDI